jgi:hypothetical protein
MAQRWTCSKRSDCVLLTGETVPGGNFLTTERPGRIKAGRIEVPTVEPGVEKAIWENGACGRQAGCLSGARMWIKDSALRPAE